MPDNSTAKKVKPFLILKPMKKHQSTLRVVVTPVVTAATSWLFEFSKSLITLNEKMTEKNTLKILLNCRQTEQCFLHRVLQNSIFFSGTVVLSNFLIFAVDIR